jgi:hypothetical protein
MRISALPYVLTALLIACSGGDEDDDPTPTIPSGPDAAQLLMDAQLAVANLQSFHFTLTQEDAAIPIPPNFDLESAEGDVVLPDRLKAELETDVQGINVSVDAIAIGSDTWITNPFTRRWQKQDANLYDYADLGALLPALLPAIEDPRLEDETSLDGVDVQLVTGEVSSADLQDALPFSLPNRRVRIELWLGVDDSLPRRVRVVGQLISGESDTAVRQIDLTRLNRRIEINPP